MLRVCLFAALALTACGGDEAPTSGDTTATASGADTRVEVRLVSDDPALRQRLSPAELLAYFPADIGERKPDVDSRLLLDASSDVGTSRATVRYRTPPELRSRFLGTVEVHVTDYVDDPQALERDGRRAETGEDLDAYGTGSVSDARTLAGGTGRTYAPDAGPPELYVLLADRFALHIRPEKPDMTVDEVWEIYDASGLARMAGAGVHGEPGAPEAPAWASGGIAEWEASAAAEAAAASEPAPESPPLAACDAILPLADVERVCGLSGLTASATPFETTGENCNRAIGQDGQRNGLIFLVSRFGDAGTARSAQRVSMQFDNQQNRREITGLGDAASSAIHDLSGLRKNVHVLSVASGSHLIEMKSEVYGAGSGGQVCTIPQMETLARGVVGRLSE